MADSQPEYTVAFDDIDARWHAAVGGKNRALGEMRRDLRQLGIAVPDGFATAAEGYRRFLAHNELEGRIRDELSALRGTPKKLPEIGERIRGLIARGDWPPVLAREIAQAYGDLAARLGQKQPSVAVRSSATAEDLPQASFAGQQESFLNVSGSKAVLEACRRCYASLFTDRAISYREERGFDHLAVALSAGVQQMVRADKGGAGVMFTIDTESGFPDLLVIDAAWGLGEAVVGGEVDPDEYAVFKPLLDKEQAVPVIHKRRGTKEHKIVYARGGEETTRHVPTKRQDRERFVLAQDDILLLARWGVAIERYYGKPMDVEWALDGETGALYILQARPETVHAREAHAPLRHYRIEHAGQRLVQGLAVGSAVATGAARRLRSPEEANRFRDGEILVTERTDPDWGPIMRRAGAIVTDHGGRTSHAAIVSRELGLPAVVGCGDATARLRDGAEVTVSCAEGGRGSVYEGEAQVTVEERSLDELPETKTAVMLNLADPDSAFRWWRLPSAGVGLARMEFIINSDVQIHPLALTGWDRLCDKEARRQIETLTRGYEDRTGYFVERLAFGIARITASQYPRPVIVRLSDFKSNEYAELIGGRQFEPDEANPMLGWRGAARYVSPEYRPGFALECRAIAKVRDAMGLTNLVVMVPFCRSAAEADSVLALMAEEGLVRGRNGLEIYVMAEIPSNVLCAEDFAERFDGFSIGSNDLTQLVLGVDRDSDRLAPLFDERDPAVGEAMRMLVEKAHRHERKVGFCGEAPSGDPNYAELLVGLGIDSISVSPDSFLDVLGHVAEAEHRLETQRGTQRPADR